MAKSSHPNGDAHGRLAKAPEEIPKRGWFDILKRVFREISDDNVSIISAGVAFYAFLAIFPAIAAIISIYGLIADPQTVQQHLSSVADVLPRQASELVRSQLGQIAKSSPSALGWGLLLSVFLSLWSANRGTSALFEGLNVVYDEKNRRGFIKNTALTLLFTLLGVIVAIISIALVIALPALAEGLGISGVFMTTLMWFRWILLAGLIMISLAAIYRYAPDRENPKWQWVSWGSVLATILWIVGSLGFSYYVDNFGNYNATYGSLAAVVILLFWFYLSSFIILIGAEFNSEIEHQTSVDTTTGKQKPMGKRGAHQADDLGEAA
jgi:membrane protein